MSTDVAGPRTAFILSIGDELQGAGAFAAEALERLRSAIANIDAEDYPTALYDLGVARKKFALIRGARFAEAGKVFATKTARLEGYASALGIAARVEYDGEVLTIAGV